MFDKKTEAPSVEERVEALVKKLRSMMWLVAVLVVVVIAALFMKRQSEKKEVEAFSLLYQAERVERDAWTDAQNPLSGGIFEKIAQWPAEKKASYKKVLSDVLSKYPKSNAAKVALLRMARLDLAEGNDEGALKSAQLLAKKKASSESALYVSMGYEIWGVILERKESWQEAVDVYEKAAKLKKNPFAAQALLGQARSLLKLNKGKEAQKIYDKIIKEYPETSFSKSAKALKIIGPLNVR